MRGLFSQWRGNDRGAAAIEFSVLAVPFIILLTGIVETTLFFATGVVLEGATNSAARTIRTGQVQAAANPVNEFEDVLCGQVSLMISCQNLQYEVMTIPDNSFLNVAALGPVFDEDGNLVPRGFSTGGSSDAVLVRVVYRHEFLTPLLGSIMTDDPDVPLMTLMSTVVIRNEPYRFGT